MTNIQVINLLKGLEQSLDDYCELNDEGKTAFRMAITALELFGNSEQLPSIQPNTTTHDSIPAETGKNDEDRTSGDLISRTQAIDKFIDELEEIFSDIREREVDDSVCGLCEYNSAYMGQSGDWCNECPGFDRDDCFKLSDKIRKEWTDEIIKALPSAQPERPRGHWVEIGDEPYDEWECDVCGFAIDGSGCIDPEEYRDVYKFCPNCGADMRGEQDDT